MRDPAGICGRVPELISLAGAHPGLKAAIATGDPHAVHRALRAARRVTTGEECATLDMLLSRRSLFLRPLGSVPSMHTVNGIGTTIYGRVEADEEAGTYVATHWFVFLFVPVLPLGQYLVSDAGASTYRFYGRVPEGALVWAWRRAAWVSAALLLASATWAGLEAWAYAKIDVVNPLDAPLRVTIGDQVKSIPPGTRARFELPRGEWVAVIALADGTPVEAIEFDTRERAEVVALNPLGAAPIYTMVAVYGEVGSLVEPRVHCGEERVRVHDVDDAWKDPPPTRPREERRRVVQLAEGGWRTCAAELWQRGEAARAAEIARRVAGLFPENLDAVAMAAGLTQRADTAAAAADWLLPIADAYPLEIQIQRELAFSLQQAGRGDEALARYRELHAANHDNPDAIYLLARVEADPAETEDLVMAGLERAPSHTGLLRVLGWLRLQQHRWTEAEEALARAAVADPENAGGYLVDRVSALAGAGRVDEVMPLLAASLDAERPAAPILVLWAALAPRSRDPAAANQDLAARLETLRANEGEAAAALVLLAAGRPLATGVDSTVAEVDRPLVQVAAALLDHPDEAARRAGALAPSQLARLDAASWILLRGEAMRAGNTALQTALDEALDLPPPAVPTLAPFSARAAREYIGGHGENNAFNSLVPAEKAAALLARSRQLSLRRGEAERLRREAEANDPLHGLVSHAASTWPP